MNLNRSLWQSNASTAPRAPIRPAEVLGLAVAVAAVIACVTLAVITGTSSVTAASHSGSSASRTSTVGTASPVPSVPPTAPPTQKTVAISSVVAKTSIDSFLTAVTKVNTKSDNLAQQLKSVAAGAIVDEIANQQQELTANGWTLRGSAILESVKVINASLAPDTAIVQACIDSSAVVTLDSDGNPLGNQSGSAARAMNVYTLQRGPTGWRVVSRTFPNDPTC